MSNKQKQTTDEAKAAPKLPSRLNRETQRLPAWGAYRAIVCFSGLFAFPLHDRSLPRFPKESAMC